MWWVDAVSSSFDHPGSSSVPICLLRIVIGLASLGKFCYEHYRGAWHFFDADCYVYYRFRKEHPRLRIGRAAYRLLYIAKFAAGALLLVGLLPQLAALVLGIWFFFERQYDRKFHTTYLGLCALFLALSPALDDALTLTGWALSGWTSSGWGLDATEHNVFAQVLIVLLTVQMYVSSAYRKLRSPHFMSGRALHDFVRSMHAVRDAQTHRETWYPQIVVQHLIAVTSDVGGRRWRPAAVATVVLEFTLSIALFVPVLFPFAVAAGAGMHAAFAAILPVRLFPFSLATAASYVLFVDPANFLGL